MRFEKLRKKYGTFISILTLFFFESNNTVLTCSAVRPLRDFFLQFLIKYWIASQFHLKRTLPLKRLLTMIKYGIEFEVDWFYLMFLQ